MATKRNVDFSNVKEGGAAFNRNRIPAGDYLATIVKVEDAQSKKDDEFQYLFTIQPKKYATRKFPYYCKLTENQLWKLRNLLIAAGISVPKRRTAVDPNKVVGKTIGVTIEDDEYEGKEQSTVAAVFPAAELVDGHQVEDDEDFVDSDDEDVEDDVEEEESDPLAELDRTEIKARIKGLDPAFIAKKSQTDDDLREVLRGLTQVEVNYDDDDDEDEEPAPAPKPAARRRKAAQPTDEDLEELDIDSL